MHIEEIVLEGFKSYATRTVIDQWDPAFNAITGLNGSGKSNILDAICFVLGITNLSQVRAQNLQDLVYKRGQAGITKASVTIVFNNEDKNQSPVGFEQHDKITITRQIVIGGKNKYIVNGHNAQHQAIQNLFQSVQLNIHNPHFLIMQGRITKVLNMKPPEILSMIEEAAGTRMFEEKKEKALKTIQKKDQKLEEINGMMENEIGPRLEKLKREKQMFMEFQKLESELERLKIYLTAFDYTQAKNKWEKGEEAVGSKATEMKNIEKRVKENQQDLKSLEVSLKHLQQRKESEMKKSGKFQQLQAQMEQIGNDLTRSHTQYELKRDAATEEETHLQQLQEQSHQLKQQAEVLKVKNEELNLKYTKQKEQLQQKQDQLGKKEGLLQTLTTGISAEEGQGNGYGEQMQSQKVLKSQAQTSIYKSKQRLEYIDNQLKQRALKKSDMEKQNEDNELKIQKLHQQIQQLEKELKSFDQQTDNSELKVKISELEETLEMIQEQIIRLKSQLSNLDFQYQLPYKGFPTDKVRGIVAKLIQLDLDKEQYSTALQICAEGRLYFVVVDDHQIASDLLKKGQLKRKYTIIPLNQIISNPLPYERIQVAKKLAPEKVQHALSLVGYPQEVEKAIEFVFGRALICKDAESAKLVAYDERVKAKAITLDGDVYEPGATITGGSLQQQSNLLQKLCRLNQLQSEFEEKQKRLNELKQTFHQSQEVERQKSEKEQALKKLEHQLSSLRKTIEASSVGQFMSEFSKLEQERSVLLKSLEENEQVLSDASIELQRLEEEMKYFHNDKEGLLKQLEKEISKMKKEVEKEQKQVIQSHSAVIESDQESKQSVKELEDIMNQIEQSKLLIQQLKQEEQDLKQKCRLMKQEYEELQSEHEQQMRVYGQFDQQLEQLQKERQQLKQKVNDDELLVKKLNHEHEIMIQEINQSQQLVLQMKEAHAWIEEQEELFGKKDSIFDFSGQQQSTGEMRKRLKQLEQEYGVLKKKINVKVMNMIDRVMTRERSLKQMLATVRKDKDKIEETINQLDQYKREALQKTWSKVNSDFGQIFGDLLPGGNTAKLEPPEGQQITEGLEVRVSLGGQWKNSLTELSGGQRSLVALSLILSLLQFKPAPMYILDEIDAALDLSHTQNIGYLFQNRFKGSQFIVVSLKEGMFMNANCLFRARFRDGTSIVERFAQQKKNIIANEGEKENLQKGQKAGQKRQKRGLAV